MKVLRVALAVFLLTLVTFALDSARVDQIVSADMAAKLTPAVQTPQFDIEQMNRRDLLPREIPL